MELDARDWVAGDNFVIRMHEAIERADRVVALLSHAYFELSRYTTQEWAAVIADRERPGRLVPLRVERVRLPGLFTTLIVRDLFDLPQDSARQVLLGAVAGTAMPLNVAVAGLPLGLAGPRSRLPGELPPVWNVPVGTAAFAGRDGDIVALRQALRDGGRAALWGIGGVGKTALAVEYAHRFAADYDLVWWVDGEQALLLSDQVAALAQALGVATATTDIATTVEAARRYLRTHPRWLLILDNVEQGEDLTALLPEGPGHVLLTSRSGVWRAVATPIAVAPLTRDESVAALCTLQPALSNEDADALAEALGDLPLALAQAGGVLAETGMPAQEYVQALREQLGQVMDEGRAEGYPRSLAAATRFAAQRLAGDSPAAAQLLSLCAFLAPDPVPLNLFVDVGVGVLPEPLNTVATQPVALRRAAGRVGGYGLATVSEDGLLLHRLTQGVLRDGLDSDGRARYRDQVANLLAAAATDDTDDPANWSRWAMLLPHVLAIEPAETSNPAIRKVATAMLRYLLLRGETRTALSLATEFHTAWRRRFGPDHPDVLAAAHRLGHAYSNLGRFEQACEVSEDTWARRCRVLGEDHPETLQSANGLAVHLAELGRLEQSLGLAEDTLARRRRMLGEDHPDTLRSASTLAANLSGLGRFEQSLGLAEDTLARRRRMLGEDHPGTLNSAERLAADLRGLGRFEQARELDEDTLVRRRQVLGEDHPDTLTSADNLAGDLRGLGRFEQAREAGRGHVGPTSPGPRRRTSRHRTFG